MMIGSGNEQTFKKGEKSAVFARKPGSMDLLNSPSSALPAFAIQTPKHLLSPLEGSKKRIPWGGTVPMDVMNTPSGPSIKEHSSHGRTFGTDYIAEQLLGKVKQVHKGGRSEVSMFKNRKSNQTNVTFYQDAAIALREGFKPKEIAQYNEESTQDLMAALLAANTRKEAEKALDESTLSIGAPPL